MQYELQLGTISYEPKAVTLELLFWNLNILQKNSSMPYNPWPLALATQIRKININDEFLPKLFII